MSKFKFGDKVRYNLGNDKWVGVGIYLGYDREVHRHVIGCDIKRNITDLKWALYVRIADITLLNESSEPFTDSTEPTVLEDLIDEL